MPVKHSIRCRQPFYEEHRMLAQPAHHIQRAPQKAHSRLHLLCVSLGPRNKERMTQQALEHAQDSQRIG
jgi:hypothetical protein